MSSDNYAIVVSALTLYSDVDAWATFFICVLLFNGLSNVALCILRYRLGMANAGMLAIRQLFLLRKLSSIYHPQTRQGTDQISMVLHCLLLWIINSYRYSSDSSPSWIRYEVRLSYNYLVNGISAHFLVGLQLVNLSNARIVSNRYLKS